MFLSTVAINDNGGGKFLRIFGKLPVKMQRCRQGNIASVSQGGDDKTTGITQVFVSVLKMRVGLSHHTVIDILKCSYAAWRHKGCKSFGKNANAV